MVLQESALKGTFSNVTAYQEFVSSIVKLPEIAIKTWIKIAVRFKQGLGYFLLTRTIKVDCVKPSSDHLLFKPLLYILSSLCKYFVQHLASLLSWEQRLRPTLRETCSSSSAPWHFCSLTTPLASSHGAYSDTLRLLYEEGRCAVLEQEELGSSSAGILFEFCRRGCFTWLSADS